MNPSQLVFVAMGGAIGAIGRYLAMSAVGAVFGHGFPYSTLFVNVVGSFVLGAFIEGSAIAWSPSAPVRSLVVIGMLGAFTTFSTFSLDTVTLLTRGETAPAVMYIVASVVVSVAALWAGMSLMRAVL